MQMPDEPQATKTLRAKVQRKPTGELLGACLMVSANDLAFLPAGTEWVTIQKKKTENGLIIELGGL